MGNTQNYDKCRLGSRPSLEANAEFVYSNTFDMLMPNLSFRIHLLYQVVDAGRASQHRLHRDEWPAWRREKEEEEEFIRIQRIL